MNRLDQQDTTEHDLISCIHTEHRHREPGLLPSHAMDFINRLNLKKATWEDIQYQRVIEILWYRRHYFMYEEPRNIAQERQSLLYTDLYRKCIVSTLGWTQVRAISRMVNRRERFKV